MNKLIKAIEKLKPYFDAIARNRYLKAIKDGFISAIQSFYSQVSSCC